jgi:hypothetical protein
MTDEQAADTITYALSRLLGRDNAMKREVLGYLTPEQREEYEAALARHRDRIA